MKRNKINFIWLQHRAPIGIFLQLQLIVHLILKLNLWSGYTNISMIAKIKAKFHVYFFVILLDTVIEIFIYF